MTPGQLIAAKLNFEDRHKTMAKINISAGTALAQIRSDRSWPDKYLSFDAYVREEWGIGRTLCKRLIREAGKANSP